MAAAAAAAAAAPAAAGARRAERGVAFDTGAAFYRPQSAPSRDLAALSARVWGRAAGRGLSVLDLYAGAGVRALRYLQHGGAGAVWANDLGAASPLRANLRAALGAAGWGAADLPALGPAEEWRRAGAPPRAPPACRLTAADARRVLAWCGLTGEYPDVVDADAFGADTRAVGGALDAVRYPGLCCLAFTAGPIAGGRAAPGVAEAAFGGAACAPGAPAAAEAGLRLLAGLAAREAAARRLAVRPLWSLHAPHGPVFRVMLAVDRARGGDAEAQRRRVGYALHRPDTGETRALSAADVAAGHAAGGLLSGPLWLGPLHDAGHLAAVEAEAAALGWLGSDDVRWAPTKKGSGVQSLAALLRLLRGEAALPEAAELGFYRTSDVARWGRLPRQPPLQALIDELRARGHAAAATHVDPGALKTCASVAAVVAAAESLGRAAERRAAHAV